MDAMSTLFGRLDSALTSHNPEVCRGVVWSASLEEYELLYDKKKGVECQLRFSESHLSVSASCMGSRSRSFKLTLTWK